MVNRVERGFLSLFCIAFGLTCITSSTWQLPLYTNAAAQQQEMTANKRFFYQNAQVPWANIYFFGGSILVVYGIFCLWLVTKPSEADQPEPSVTSMPHVEARPEPPQTPARLPDPEPITEPVRKVPQRARVRLTAPAYTPTPAPVAELEPPPAPSFFEDVPVAPSFGGEDDDRVGKHPSPVEPKPEPIVLPIAIRPTTNISGLFPACAEDSHDDIELTEEEPPFEPIAPEESEVFPDEELLDEEPDPVYPARVALERLHAQTAVEADFQHEPDSLEDFAAKFEDPYIARKIAKCGMSIILSAQSRAGKTSFWKTVMLYIAILYGYVDWHIVDQKNRTWLGLERKPGVVVVPSVENKYVVFAKKVATVHSILSKRRELTPDEVAEIHPVYLVLDDYHSLISLASNYLDSTRYKRMLASLNYIVTMGAYFRVFAVFLTQSHGIESLKWADKNTRTSLIFLSLGRVSKDADDDEQGSYASVSLAIGDSNIIPVQLTRNRLAQEYSTLQVIAEQNSRSLGFTTLGRERLMLMPYFDEKNLSPLYVEPEVDGSLLLEEAVAEAEPLALQPASPEPTEAPAAVVPEVPTVNVEPLAEEPLAEHFQAIIHLSERFKREGKNDGWITARDFRINAPGNFRSRYTADELRFYFVRLAQLRGQTEGAGISLRYQA